MLVPVLAPALMGLLSSFAQHSCGYDIHAVYALFWRSTSSASWSRIRCGVAGNLADLLADDRAYHGGSSFSNAVFNYSADFGFRIRWCLRELLHWLFRSLPQELLIACAALGYALAHSAS